VAVDSYTIKVRKAKVIGVYPLIATGGHAIKRASMDGDVDSLHGRRLLSVTARVTGI
jgi:hypothetical protein